MNLFFGLDALPGPLSSLGSYDWGYEAGRVRFEEDAAAAAAAAAVAALETPAAAAAPSQCLIRKGRPAAPA